MDDLRVIRMDREHLRAVHGLDELCFTLPWSYESFEDELSNAMAHYYVAVDAWGEVIAYAGFWAVLDEAHVTNVAVHPDHRRRGVGRRLMLHMMRRAAAHEVRSMTLEVRQSNRGAQAMYRELGFVVLGRRKRYYIDNHEDALVLWNNDIARALEKAAALGWCADAAEKL